MSKPVVAEAFAVCPDPLPIAGELVRRLAERKVGYGVYKNVDAVSEGLAGLADLDLLVSREDADGFRAVMVELGGVRGLPGLFSDNVVEGREEWFIPSASGQFLHLDVVFGLRVGRRFRKRYLAVDYKQVAEWAHWSASLPIPVVAGAARKRIALLRAVFETKGGAGSDWLDVVAGRADLIGGLSRDSVRLEIGGEVIDCPVLREGERVKIGAKAAGRVRKLLRQEAGGTAAVNDAVHNGRRLLYGLAKRLTRFKAGRSAAKRSLPTGMVVAVIGPDGTGKSTQVDRLAKLFGAKFRCASLYLGSNDGGNRFRRAVGQRREKARQKNASLARQMTPADRTTMQQLGVSMWRLLVALTRLATAQKALRLAASGALVICDRWPQSIAPGMLDGPALEPPPSMRLARLISRVEQWLYQRMDGLRPTLTIHLTCPYETSATRKPGAIEREDFDRRVVLMEELRRRDPSIQVVDVRQDMEKVTSDLLGHVWARLVAPGPIKLAPASQADLLLPTVTPQTVALGEPAVVV